MNPRFSIRRIRPADDAAVATLIRTVMPEFGASGPGYAIMDPEVDAMSAAYDDPRAVYYVVVDDEDGGRVVGGAGLGPLAGGDEETCELRKMYFYAAARGQGVGRELLARCLEAARARGFLRCYIETLDRMEAAQRLYASFGFRVLPGPCGDTGHHRCDRYFELDLVEAPRVAPMTAVSEPPPPLSARERPVPRRWNARFDDTNDHNPLVLEDCADCGGRGTICVELDGVAELGTCPSCAGAGTTGRAVPYFADAPPLAAAREVGADAERAIVCPNCGDRFSADDRDAWTGRRHKACGAPLRFA